MKRNTNLLPKHKKLKCDVCGCRYSPQTGHYIVRDNMETSLASAFSGAVEADIYDAFDCPVCGCQKLIQKRKRALILKGSGNKEWAQSRNNVHEDDEIKEEESDE